MAWYQTVIPHIDTEAHMFEMMIAVPLWRAQQWLSSKQSNTLPIKHRRNFARTISHIGVEQPTACSRTR